jgi:hypothetical protein
MLSNNLKKVSVLLVAAMFMVVLHSAYAFKFDLKKTVKRGLKAAGIAALIKQFGPELNKFINQALNDKGVPNIEDTKVVPIFTFGGGIEAGACQVAGPTERIAQVQAVYAVEASLDKGHKFNMQLLVPTSSINPVKLSRVYGVGVTGIIDYKL